MLEEERVLRFAFHRIAGIGNKFFSKVFSAPDVGSFSNLLRLSNSEFSDFCGQKTGKKIKNFLSTFNFDRELSVLKSRNIDFVVLGERDYPENLSHIFNPPLCLYFRGNLEDANSELPLGFVGSRKASSYGLSRTRKLIRDLASHLECTIISGLAYGIDSCAHKSAIEYKLPTGAVLASSVDDPTPRGNGKLYEDILSSGGFVCSENYPGGRVARGSFVTRNRIVAGLACGVVIAEASIRSGSLSTANRAFENSRHVFCIPGDIGTVRSAGCNFLIKTNKAKLVEDAGDILEEFEYNIKSINGPEVNLQNDLQRQVYNLLRKSDRSLEELVELTKEGARKLVACVSMLELKGIVEKMPNGMLRLVL